MTMLTLFLALTMRLATIVTTGLVASWYGIDVESFD
jgi:hypothetical protein